MSIVRQDTFSRANVSSGWGTATDGNTWTIQSGDGQSVSSNEGIITGSTASTFATLGAALSGADAEGLVRFEPQDTTSTAGILLRWTDSSNHWLSRYDGAGHVVAMVKVSGTYTTLSPSFSFTPSTTNFYWLRFRCQGTTISFKVWQDGTSEPSSWSEQYTGQSSQNVAGNVGLYGFCSSGNNSYDTFSVDNLANTINGSATILAEAGILGGVSGASALPGGINAGPALGGGINGNAAISQSIFAFSGLGGGINASPALGGGIAAQGASGGGVAGQGEVTASSASLNSAILQGVAGFIQGLAGQGIIPAVTGTLGGAIHGVATILAESGLLGGFGAASGLSNGLAALGGFLGGLGGSGSAGGGVAGQGMVFGSTTSLNQATVTGSGNLSGGFIGGIADILANGGILRLHPFTFAINAIKALLNFGFSVKPALSTGFVTKPLLSFAFSVAPKLSAVFAVKPLLTFIFQPEPAVAQPNSSIQVIATLTDINGNPVTSAATCNVTVTFPDGTTSSFSLGSGVVNNGNGTYTLSYNTKTPGPHTEDWSATDQTGNKTEYHHVTPVSF